MSPSFRKLFTFYPSRNNLRDLPQSRKKLNVIVLTALLLAEKINRLKQFLFFHVSKEMLSPKANARDNIPSHFFSRTLAVYRCSLPVSVVSGSLFFSPCPPECYLQSETKIEPDLRLLRRRVSHSSRARGIPKPVSTGVENACKMGELKRFTIISENK